MVSVVVSGSPRISLDQVKRFLADAMPIEPAMDIYMEILPDGSLNWDGPIKTVPNPLARRGEAFMEADFPSLFAELDIVPRMISRPTYKDFGPGKSLAEYSITTAEFVKLAECYGIAVTIGPPTAEAKPPHSPPVKEDVDWKEIAQDRARAYIRMQKDRDLYPNQMNVADHVAQSLRRDGIFGPDGKPLSGATIKRHALSGISSAVHKRLSTVSKRGK